MLVLHETPAGYSLFKITDSKKYKKTDAADLSNTDAFNIQDNISLVRFQPFADTADAVAAITAAQEGQVTETLANLLHDYKKKTIAVADKALAVTLAQEYNYTSIEPPNEKTTELFRCIRSALPELLCMDTTTTTSVSADDLQSMRLGLSHAFSRYKLKFSADKVDTMIIQGIGLLDELDKEINVYAMRTKEWYGWHFPELQQIVSDNAKYAKLVTVTGHRHVYATADLSQVWDDDEDDAAEEMIDAVQKAAEVSMGTDVTDLDVLHIQSLAEQVLSLTEYRAQLYEYLHNRMNALAPNLTILTGELVGARLIAHAGSLLNLAKQPASTIQIAGAEKALFRALKTKHDTPKYGLLYHASLVGQAAPAHKGKISRVLAAKAALAVRVDALTEGDTVDPSVGHDGRAKVQARLRQLEGGTSNNGGSAPQKTAVYHATAAKQASGTKYNTASDLVMEEVSTKRKSVESTKSNGGDDDDDDDAEKKRMKKEKKKKKKSMDASDANGDESKKRKAVEEEAGDDDKAAKKSAKKAKKAKKEKKKSS